MEKDDVLGGIGAVGSTIFVFLGYMWNLGVIQLVFSFLAGSFSTYIIQHKLQVQSEKRRISREHDVLMRDRVYGPLFKYVQSITTRLEEHQNPAGHYNDWPLKGIQETANSHLYLLSDKGIIEKITKVCTDLSEYQTLYQAAEDAVYDVSFTELKREFVDADRVDPFQTWVSLNEHRTTVRMIHLREAVMSRTNPFKLFREDGVKCEEPKIEVHSPDKKTNDPERMEKVFTEINKTVWREKRLLDYEKKRQGLLNDLDSLIPKLREKIAV
ncbi:MAG: hypothetical protein NWF00_04830 [Candidatus Bathyarchaeota archaeon]|nr:hypothetical protein [Candidatus Bathyarchaeota archaeon]